MKELKSRRSRRLLIALLCGIALVASCTARWPAKPTGRQKTLINSNGEAVVLRLWAAERVVKLPFFDDPSGYVSVDDRRYRIHAGGFGSGIGDIRASVDGNYAIVERSFEGGAQGGLLIDLRTRKLAAASGGPLRTQWVRHAWRTRLELAGREEVHLILRSSDAEMGMAMDELKARGFDNSDWIAIARGFADPTTPERARRYLGFVLVHGREEDARDWRRRQRVATTASTEEMIGPFDPERDKLDWPDEVIQFVGSALTDPDPSIQGRAVKNLTRMLPDAVIEAEIGAGINKYDTLDDVPPAHVRQYQGWWQQRTRRPPVPTTSPTVIRAPETP